MKKRIGDQIESHPHTVRARAHMSYGSKVKRTSNSIHPSGKLLADSGPTCGPQEGGIIFLTGTVIRHRQRSDAAYNNRPSFKLQSSKPEDPQDRRPLTVWPLTPHLGKVFQFFFLIKIVISSLEKECSNIFF